MGTTTLNANDGSVLTWATKPTAAEFGVGQAWFSDIGAMGYSDGSGWHLQDLALPPRIVDNLLATTTRFPSGSVFGTGVATASTEMNSYGVKNGILTLNTGSAGRAFWSSTQTLLPNTWYALSFEIVDTPVLQSAQNILSNSGGTATVDRGLITITTAKAVAGGVGRYAAVFCSTAGGTIIPRLGVGIGANETSKTLVIKNLQLEILDSSKGLYPGEHVYAGFKAAFSYHNPNTLDSNNKVVVATEKRYFKVKRFSNILSIGDSRNDEPSNIGGQLNNLLGNYGNCAWHAQGGWTTSDMVGPTVIKTATLTFADALAGNVLCRTASGDGDDEIYNYNGTGYYPYDTLLIPDFGYNDINSAGVAMDGADTAYANIISFAAQARALGMDVVMASNNPFNAHATYSADKLTAVKSLDSRLATWCKENNAYYVYTYDALGDSTDRDKLSDGSGTTPNYSQDMLHLSTLGSVKYASLVKDVMDSAAESNYQFKELKIPKTVTLAATTGAQTINKPSGTINLAAAATSLVVTNNLVNANSIINCTVASNDTTTKSVAVVATEGSFTIYPDAAPTAVTRVNFIVIN